MIVGAVVQSSVLSPRWAAGRGIALALLEKGEPDLRDIARGKVAAGGEMASGSGFFVDRSLERQVCPKNVLLLNVSDRGRGAPTKDAAADNAAFRKLRPNERPAAPDYHSFPMILSCSFRPIRR